MFERPIMLCHVLIVLVMVRLCAILGHDFSKKGVMVNPMNIEVIHEWAWPISVLRFGASSY